MKPLRGFLLGVLRWPPATALQQATLQDIADAIDGYWREQGLDHQNTINRAFLHMMAAKFPDTRTT